MGDALDPVELGELGHEQDLPNAAAQAGVRLDDVDRPAVEQLFEGLSVLEHLATGDGDVELCRELFIPSIAKLGHRFLVEGQPESLELAADRERR